MKSIKNSLILAFFAVLVFSSCKNDLKLNAPYKEYPSIYAVLNPDEDVQMIRINKVFLGETDANQMAKVSDSINYKADEITVILKHSVNPAIITFSEAVIHTAEGTFNSEQRVYVTPTKLETSGIYTLVVTNNHTGNVFTATTIAISKISQAQSALIFSPPFYPYPATTDPNLYIDYSVQYPKYPYNVRFTPNEGAVYKIILRMHFYDSLYDGSKTYNYVDYTSENIEKKTKTEILISFRGADVFNSAGVGMSKSGLSNDILGRKMYKIEYVINSSTQDYLDYLQYASPSLSINQNKPLYSNFKDGKALGIFTFRTTFTMSKSISTTFVSTFSDNPSTCKYKFYTSSLTLKGCK